MEWFNVTDQCFALSQANAIANQAEKRQRLFDKTIDEWKRKVADLQSELDNAHAESRGGAAEVYRLKAQLEEYSDNIDALRRENKNLSGRSGYRGRCVQ